MNVNIQDSELALELVRILPSVLWFILATIALWIFQNSIRKDLIPRLSSFKGFGVELAFLKHQLDEAIKNTSTEVSRGDRRGVLKRAGFAQPFLQGGKILWVDDNPHNNDSETELFRSLGMRIKAVTNTTAALEELERRSDYYDVVISDFKRGDDDRAGPDLAKSMWEKGLYRWTVIYSGRDPWGLEMPPYLFGMTNRPDHLIHYVIDIMEREASG